MPFQQTLSTTSPAGAVQVVPTVSASAYVSGESVGGLIAFPNAARGAGLGGLLQAVTATFPSAISPALDLVLFSAMPSSTITDSVAVAISAADLPLVVGTVHLSDYTSVGTPVIGQSQQQAVPFVLAGTTLYAVLIARASFSLASTSDLTLTVQLLLD